jgi:GNAT superfamily N-acetyltransferase
MRSLAFTTAWSGESWATGLAPPARNLERCAGFSTRRLTQGWCFASTGPPAWCYTCAGNLARAFEQLARLPLICEETRFDLGRVSLSIRDAALAAGFTDDPGAEQPHYSAHAWYIEGEPRFGGHVNHPCEVIEGTELLPLFMGADANEDKRYIRACLERQPSYVCKVAGEPVCWSCTHLGGAMGRIFTLPEHRGQGYGKSLTAFQVDDTLCRRGIAVASVSVANPASARLLTALGAQHLPEPLTWSHMRWPVKARR